MYRSGEYDKLISEKLRNGRAFAQEYLLGMFENDEKVSVENCLKTFIQRMGLKEFSEKTKVPTSNISEFLNGKRKLKPETLNVYLKPFGLRVRLVVERAA